MRIRFYNRDPETNSLVDAESVVFADNTNSYGIKRIDTDEIVVPSGTTLGASFDDGSYEYVFNGLPFTSYRYAITWTYNGTTKTIENVILSTDSETAYNVYTSVSEADIYFNQRLHSEDWFDSSNDDKIKALITATKIIDRLRYSSRKYDFDQPLEFPRLSFSPIPNAIKEANAEIAFALLQGADPDRDYRNLRVTSRRYSSVGTTYDPNIVPPNILAGVPSLTAWNLLLPYFSRMGGVRLHRAS